MFILEKEILNVKNTRIKSLLEEVLSSYYQGNYRSAIVVNYTAVIMDLLDKVSDLSNIYQDPSAKKISEKIKRYREEHNKSPKWEWDLIEQISNDTELIDAYELIDLDFVRTQRNYAAHPIVKHDDDEWSMKEITKETCSDVIRKSYEIVFLKQPILSKKIIMDILEFANKTINSPGMTDENFELVLSEKYLKYLPNDVKNRLIKTLYKFIFTLGYDNEHGNSYRWSNVKLLIILLKKDTDDVIDVLCQMKLDTLILPVETATTLSAENINIVFSKVLSLLRIISHVPKIKEKINSATIANSRASVWNFYNDYTLTENDVNFFGIFNARSEAILDDPEIHLDHMLDLVLCSKPINPRLSTLNVFTLDLLYNQFNYYGKRPMFINYVVEHLTNSASFYESDKDMQLIPWLYDKIDKVQFDKLILKMNENNQFYLNGYFKNFFDDLEKTYENKFNINLHNSYYGLLFSNLIKYENKPDLNEEQIRHLLTILDKNEVIRNLQAYEIQHHYNHIIHRDEYNEIGQRVLQDCVHLKSVLNY